MIDLKLKLIIVPICLLSLLLASSCVNNTEPPTSSTMEETTTISLLKENPLISQERVSQWRIGINSTFFTLSETGVYTVCSEKTGNYVLYCDLHSDTFVKLCSRPDCPHNNSDCDANLGGDFIPPLCYYRDALYYIRPQTMIADDWIPATLIQMDKDGRNKRELVYCYPEDEIGLSGLAGVQFAQGFIEGDFSKVNNQGKLEVHCRYTSLQSPDVFWESALISGRPEEQPVYRIIYASDGDGIICQGDLLHSNYENPLKKIYAWNPDNDSLQEIGEIPATPGVFNRHTGYYYENGYAMQWDYEKKSGTPLFDTGIRGNALLVPFPDCIVAYEYWGRLPEKPSEGVTVKIRFFDWNYAFLGECQLRIEESLSFYGNHIFGETEDRILIIKDPINSLPDYYINKSELGSGDIILHEYHYPEIDLLFRR